MKVQLLVNLKLVEGIVSMGTVYSDVDGPFPIFIQDNLNNPSIVKVLDFAPGKIAENDTPEEIDETDEPGGTGGIGETEASQSKIIRRVKTT